MSAVVVTSENSGEFYAKHLGLEPEPAAAAEPVKGDAEPAVESVKDEELAKPEADADDQSGKATDPEAKQKVSYRFSELTEQRKAAEADAAKARDDAKAARERAELAERQAADLRAKYEPPKPDQLGPEPTRAQFANEEEFLLALKDHAGEKAIRDRDQKDAAAKIERAWTERQTATKAELPDYDAVIAGGADLVVSNQVRDAILESEQGPKILYHLAKNPALVEELKRASAASALRKIGNLEATFEAEKAPKVEPKPAVAAPEISRAPAPIQPLRAATTSAEPLVDAQGEFHGTFAQYKAARKAGKI